MPSSFRKRNNPVTRRMAEDMLLRNMAVRTIDSYTYHVERFSKHFGKLPEDLGPEEIREFQLWMIQVKKCSWSSFNQAVCGLRFLYTFTLPRPWVVQMIPFGNRPKKLPVVLGQEEVHRLIQCVTVPKHRAVLLTLYAAGLRLSEATNLKLPDIDSERMQMRIIQAKGHKDRYVPLSPRLLSELRAYWKLNRPTQYLFPGKTDQVPLSGATIQKTCKMAAAGSAYQEDRYSTYSETFFRDGIARSRGRSHGDQQAARAQQLYDHHDLFTLSAGALGLDAQSDRLASRAAMPTLDRPVAAETEQRQDSGERGSARTGTGLTVANLLKRYTPDFVDMYRPNISRQVESTLARIGFCRTAPLGGRTYACQQCQTSVSVYNSCTDRHCPQCSGARRGDWLDKAAELLLPGVTYFQVVFTLPDKLASLILGNRRELYRTLMHAAWESLKQCIETELGMQAAAIMVLHTWNQRLEHHPHVHLLVPGSGPSLDGQRWIECKLTKATRSEPAKPFLVDNHALGQKFCKRFMLKLKSLYRRGKLQLEDELVSMLDPITWAAFTESLLEHDWCVFIERPPHADSTPEHVLKYLARYMTGGPISDRRLVSCENDVVTFMARSKDKTKPKQQTPVKLSGVEFTRRWSLHILPKGFTRTRYFGGYSSGQAQGLHSVMLRASSTTASR